MSRNRTVRLLLRVYILGVVLVGIGTVVWTVAPELADSPIVASAWFTVVGFGVLVLILVGFFHLER